MTTPRDRDRSTERLLRASFKTSDSGVTDVCLDGETMAALSEGGVSGAALERAQAHLADCGRCRAIVGTLVRVAAIAPTSAGARAPRHWLGWLVPATAAAAALALWIAVPRGPGADKSAAPATAETAAPKVAPQLTAAPEASTTAVAAQRPEEPPEQKPNTRQLDAAKTDEKAAGPVPDRPARGRAEEAELRKDAQRVEVDSLKQVPPGGQSSAGFADKAASPNAAAPAAGAPAAPPAAAAPPAVTRELPAPAANTLTRTAARAVIVSPDRTIRWRITGAVLERSTDGGARWTALPTGVTSELTNGSAPSPTACWVVGRAGVVLRTTDGQNFTRVPFPEATDLSAIEATDAQRATVTTQNRRTYTTADGGSTWTTQ